MGSKAWLRRKSWFSLLPAKHRGGPLEIGASQGSIPDPSRFQVRNHHLIPQQLLSCTEDRAG